MAFPSNAKLDEKLNNMKLSLKNVSISPGVYRRTLDHRREKKTSRAARPKPEELHLHRILYLEKKKITVIINSLY